MKVSQKHYAVAKVLEIADCKKTHLKGKKPGLTEYIYRAAVEGTLRTIPATRLLAEAKEKVLKSSARYSDCPSFTFEEMFAQPQPFIIAVKRHKQAALQVEAANAKVDNAAAAIVDSINLDEFEDGKAAIALAEKIKPARV